VLFFKILISLYFVNSSDLLRVTVHVESIYHFDLCEERVVA
jgi:hypothetical protein